MARIIPVYTRRGVPPILLMSESGSPSPIEAGEEWGPTDIFIDRISIEEQSGFFAPRRIAITSYFDAGRDVTYERILELVVESISNDLARMKRERDGAAVPGDNSPMLGGDKRQERSDGLSA